MKNVGLGQQDGSMAKGLASPDRLSGFAPHSGRREPVHASYTLTSHTSKERNAVSGWRGGSAIKDYKMLFLLRD